VTYTGETTGHIDRMLDKQRLVRRVPVSINQLLLGPEVLGGSNLDAGPIKDLYGSAQSSVFVAPRRSQLALRTIKIGRFAMRLVSLLAGVVATLSTTIAFGQAALAFPDRPVTLVVGYPAGGGTDIQARVIAPFLEKHLGVPVVVENRPGASRAAIPCIARCPACGTPAQRRARDDLQPTDSSRHLCA
jgi:hypothetical protein